MSRQTLDKLIYMANQIAVNFRAPEGERAAEATADHLWRFWDPRMRTLIVEHLRGGGEGLNDIARAGVTRLASSAGPPPPVTKATQFSDARDPDLISDAG